MNLQGYAKILLIKAMKNIFLGEFKTLNEDFFFASKKI